MQVSSFINSLKILFENIYPSRCFSEILEIDPINLNAIEIFDRNLYINLLCISEDTGAL